VSKKTFKANLMLVGRSRILAFLANINYTILKKLPGAYNQEFYCIPSMTKKKVFKTSGTWCLQGFDKILKISCSIESLKVFFIFL
jgi:hypothetical protein